MRASNRIWLTAIAVLLVVTPCAAQVVGDAPPAPAPTTGSVDILTRFAFHLNAASFVNGDERFSWDADFGGEVDLLQYQKGRLTFVGNIEAILGKELRRFDVEQGNYILAGSFSRQTKHGELAGVLQHVSRHLSDRPKLFGVDWNLLGIQWNKSYDVEVGRYRDIHIEAHGLLGRTVTTSFVDYTWMMSGGATARRPVNGRVTSFGSIDLTLVGTEDPNPRRGVLKGSGIEAGVRVRGAAADVEFFGRVEHRIDAEMLEKNARNWLLLGFRVLSR